jgi:phosphinothricin acetyltransferase
MNIRLAAKSDWQAIITIYNHAVDEKYCTADTEHITVESRLEWLKQHSPDTYPIIVSEIEGIITGWCSLSPYRPGRQALKSVAEISYYIHKDYRRRGTADSLIDHALKIAPQLGLRNLIAILLDVNTVSIRLLEKYGFSRWGYLPNVAFFKDKQSGQYIYGKRI